ncbi:hypothetical protein [Deinococcus yavapaiensis]|uniref:Uncharacterized protein n=1 Tax=Deinococcus yavapaiensis KR-236 TaxID=694435 RepID=A0A318SBR0_9DEIO|nr:hypothetical protein [Deinococcus yavapaiensis]PYE53790.1 hypothetical protein DES52_10748 [Deinococcus yavapaiensis KR-236]
MKRPLLLCALLSAAIASGGTAQPVWNGSQGLPPGVKPNTSTAAPPAPTSTFESRGSSNLKGIQLTPLQAEVKVGASLTLDLVACVNFAASGIALPPNTPSYLCEPSFFTSTAKNWSVNGTPGGNASVGTIKAGQGGQAVYTAPAKKPSRNPVAVSVEVNDPELGRVTLVANVQVVEPASWEGTITYTEEGTDVWKMRDGFQGAGIEIAKQTQTFKVVGSREESPTSTVLVLEQVGSASYSDSGQMEKRINEICQAFGPTILRHHFVYGRSFEMKGEVKATIEARLFLANGRYSLALAPQNVLMIGQDRKTDIYKDGCANTTNDRSNTKQTRTTADLPTFPIEGPVFPSRPDMLRGQTEGTSELFVQKTDWKLGWTLTRTR